MRRILKHYEVAQFDGISLCGLADGHHKTSRFKEILLASLQLLKEIDPRRFARVQNRLDFVVGTTLRLRGIAQYDRNLRCCEIDFLEPSPQFDPEFLVGWYACTLIHESTHGVIEERGISYTPELRPRIEQLCVAEEQRFVARLKRTRPELASRFQRKFDPVWYEKNGYATPWQDLVMKIRRGLQSDKAE